MRIDIISLVYEWSCSHGDNVMITEYSYFIHGHRLTTSFPVRATALVWDEKYNGELIVKESCYLVT